MSGHLRKADRIDGARDFLRDLSNDELKELSLSKAAWIFRLDWNPTEQLLIAEKLHRGLITLADLTPGQRRASVAANPDLHAIASGPIMDPANIYLPAGKLSMAETRDVEMFSAARTILAKGGNIGLLASSATARPACTSLRTVAPIRPYGLECCGAISAGQVVHSGAIA